MQFNIKGKCPSCGSISKAKWLTSPVLLTCKCGVKWHPRQDVLSAVYIHKKKSEEDYLAA